VVEVFVHLNDFIPERWTVKPELLLDARAYAPFSFGTRYTFHSSDNSIRPYRCIAKARSHLEPCAVTAKLIVASDVSFSVERGQKPANFWEDMEYQVTMMSGKLWCVFEP
jgi:hypothetical protein